MTRFGLERGYAPLWVKSNFSFLEGASHPHELVEQAHRWGLAALALTDRDGVHGVVQAHMKAKELGLQLLVGAQISVGDLKLKSQTVEPAPKKIILLAQTRAGYGKLCQLISKGRSRSEKGSCLVSTPELQQMGQGQGLLALCPEPVLLPRLRSSFENRLYALCTRHQKFEEQPREDALRHQAENLRIPTVAANEVLYHGPHRQPLHDVLTCIRHGVALNGAGTLIQANAEHALKTPQSMHELFSDDPDSLTRTLEIVERCSFSLDQLRYRYPAEDRPEGLSERAWLHDLTFEGAQNRYGEILPSSVRQQIERELEIVHDLDYGGYFLTMWEIVQFCRRENILCQGRGSAANSVVCYCLGITAIDPIRLDLLFERFLSRERAEPPDIDLDIEHQRREEVIQWMYRRYGRRHAAMVANVIRYRTRSAIREVGKVLNIPATALDRLSKLMGGRFSDLGPEALSYAGLDPQAPRQRHLLTLIEQIRDFPRHLSVHPGGFILGHEPVDTLVPIEPATMDDRTVIQWDKYSAEDLGLFKVDLLGLGALTQIHQCFDLLRKHQNVDLTLGSVPSEDPTTYRMISRGDTVGVFQIESRAQMSMLPRLRPQTFYDLVIEVAIVRPGPIQGDMVHPYLKRRRGEQEPTYPHPKLRRVLEKTLGVPIFQEQVMKIAVLVGGYSPGEADQLRRDMAAWKSSGRIERHRDQLVQRMIQNDIPPEFAERIFSQIRGFGEYGFPESHAASFALIAYITAWLRCHYPAAFTCSILNAQPMGFYSPATLVEDAKRHGVIVLPIDVNASVWDCSLEKIEKSEPSSSDLAVRMGLRYVKGLGARERDILENAQKNFPPPYLDLNSFVHRIPLSVRALTQIAQSGGFESLGVHRRDALWAVKEAVTRRQDSLNLPPPADQRPHTFAALSRDEQIFWDYRTSEHSTRGHPIMRLRNELDRAGIPDAVTLNALPDGSRTSYVGMTICRQRPGTATGVTFYTLEDETGIVNLVVWSQVFARYAIVARTALLMGVTGKIQSESGVIHLIADKLWEPDLLFDPQGTHTRSFH